MQDESGNFLTSLPSLQLSFSDLGYTGSFRQVVPGLFAIVVTPNLLFQVTSSNHNREKISKKENLFKDEERGSYKCP